MINMAHINYLNANFSLKQIILLNVVTSQPNEMTKEKNANQISDHNKTKPKKEHALED